MTETQKQVVKWLATGRVGMSSKCMAMRLALIRGQSPCRKARSRASIWQHSMLASKSTPVTHTALSSLQPMAERGANQK